MRKYHLCIDKEIEYEVGGGVGGGRVEGLMEKTSSRSCFVFFQPPSNIGQLWTFSLHTHKLSILLLLLKTPAGSSSIWFPPKLLQQEYIMDISWAFLKCLPARQQKPFG